MGNGLQECMRSEHRAYIRLRIWDKHVDLPNGESSSR